MLFGVSKTEANDTFHDWIIRDRLRKRTFCQSAKILKKLFMIMIIVVRGGKEASVARLLPLHFDYHYQESI
ncbi:hypothetical protein ACX27_24780 [Nostoc piscinale CENA21]|uniref:Uncharacterized protein n=2 Tax=Nostoc TaxID=1177 RepID=A0A0M4T063_9NOSO|nr:hypothetical protein ACX27_24780 [Nostoc piscinale CENA21]